MTDASDLFTFASDDGHLAYRDTGSGPPVVLLHSGFADHTVWDDQVPVLAERYRVIAPDARGHGGSANASRPFRPADDLAALLRHLGTGPATLVGLSMGAITAVDTALEHPGLVRALVISGGGVLDGPVNDPRSDDALAAGDIERWLDNIADWVAGPHRTREEVDPGIVRRIREASARTVAKHTVDEPDHYIPVRDAAARAAGIAVPLLAVNGALDAPGLLAMTESLACGVADGRTVTIEGVGHYPNMERPDAFNRAVDEFLETVYAGER
ncbi:alpha/beta fold hydrolase [Streptomyces sp. NPDC048644]|uniref:alpha/beta fold hydrolase n=1 Tax=Streptomyces sp. NPDC048644 TaxID=3365582 RepID=UPI00371D8044